MQNQSGPTYSRASAGGGFIAIVAFKTMLHYGLKKEGRITLEQYNNELEESTKPN